MHARQRCVYVQQREVGIRGGRWMDKDNKRGKGSIHTTHQHTDTHTTKTKKALRFVSTSLTSSLQHNVPKNTKKWYLTHRNSSQHSQKNKNGALGMCTAKTEININTAWKKMEKN